MGVPLYKIGRLSSWVTPPVVSLHGHSVNAMEKILPIDQSGEQTLDKDLDFPFDLSDDESIAELQIDRCVNTLLNALIFVLNFHT